MSKSKELQKRIDRLRKEIQNIAGTDLSFQRDSAVQITHRQSEIFVAASQLAEISTRRIVRLTWVLAILTVALLAIAFIQTEIVVKQNLATNVKSENTDNNKETPSSKQQPPIK